MHRIPFVFLTCLGLLGCSETGPGGGRTGELLFQSNRDGDFDLYGIMPDGSGLRPLTQTVHNEVHPAWSPNGRLIAYVSDQEPAGVYVMNADGSNPHPLQSASMHAEYPSWSPNGDRLAFESDQSGVPAIWIVNRDGTGLRRLTSNAIVAKTPAWSPDGSRIAFQVDLRYLATSAPDSFALTPLGTTPLGSVDMFPAWSPSGTSLAFARFVLDSLAHQSVWAMSSSGTQVRRLTTWVAGIDFTPVWSPDGKQIAFAHDVNDNYDIYIMEWDGSDQRNITNHPGINYRPSW